MLGKREVLFNNLICFFDKPASLNLQTQLQQYCCTHIYASLNCTREKLTEWPRPLCNCTVLFLLLLLYYFFFSFIFRVQFIIFFKCILCLYIFFLFVLGFRFEQKLNTTKFRIYYLLVCKDMKRDNNNKIIVMNTKQQHTHGHWPAHNNTHINRHRVHQLFSSFYIYFSIFCLDFHPI